MHAINAGSNVLQFGKKPPRRATFAKLSENYISTLAGLLTDVKINDGTTDAAGDPLVRDPHVNEIRHGAIITAMQFCVALIRNRVAIEVSAGVQAPNLLKFHDKACERVVAETTRRLGPGIILTLPPEHVRALTHTESAIAQGIFGAFRLEIQGNAGLQEHEFWRDVFLGLGDGDETGVVIAAARVVFLDHVADFEIAWLGDVMAQSPEITRN